MLIMLAACSAAPLHAPQGVGLPDVWRAPLPHDGSSAALTEWWRAFPDPRLAGLIERAQAANPDLMGAAARLARARALAKDARASLLPQAGATAASSRGMNLDGVPGISVQSDALFSASWELDLFGEQREAASAQAAQAVAAEHDWHAARVTLAADVAVAYVNLRLAQAREQLGALDGELASELVTWGRQEKAAGLSNGTALALLRVDASLLAASRSDRRAEAEVALQALSLLLAVPAAELAAELQAPGPQPGRPSPRLEMPRVPAFEVDGLPAQLLARRPDVAAAHQRWVAAQAHQRSVDAQRYPQLSLGALVGEGRLRVGGTSSVSSTWSVGPSLSIPLFDGGSRRARGAAAQAEAEEAAAALQAKWQAAVAEVEESLQRVVAARERQREAESALQERHGIAERAALQLQAGLYSGPQRATAQRDALAAHGDLIAAQADQAHAWFRLYRSLGGGWNADPRPAAPPESHP